MEGKKRVLVFIPEFPALTETFIEREISKLIERGNVDINVISLKKGRGRLSNNIKDNITYERLDIFTSISAFFTYLPKLGKLTRIFKELKDSGKGFLEKIYLFVKAIGYTKIFNQFDPDIIYAHFMSTPSTIAMISSRILDIPYCISAHAKDITVEAEYIDEKIKSAKFVTICNRNAYEYLLKVSSMEDSPNVYLIYHGVDFKTLKEQVPQFNVKKQVPLLLSIGRLVEKKGYKYLIEASKILKDRGFAHEIKIIAGGPLYQNTLMQIKKFKLEDRVEILGEGKGLPFIETAKYFRVADIFVFPSIETSSGDVDGVANVLLEAAAFKVPIIASDAGGTTEVVINNKTGLVVPQRDPEKLANAIQVLLQNKSLGYELAERAYTHVSNAFNLDENVEKIERLLLKWTLEFL